MVGHFVSLKLRLLRNGLVGNRRRMTSLIIAVVVALPIAGLAFTGLAAMRANHGGRFDVATLGFTALFLAWIVFPLISFGSDETLDPSRLALLPLTRRQLISGLAAASAVGIAPVATMIGLAGVVVGYAEGIVSLVIVTVAVVVELALCIVASRAVTTALAGLLRSRKARDLSIIFVTILSLGFRVAAQFSGFLFEPRHRHAVDTAARWAAVTPPGLAGRAAAQAAAGHFVGALVALAAAVVFTALLGWCWWAALDHLLTTADSTGPRRRTEAGPASASPLFGTRLRWLPPTRTGAVTARELRYAGRDPRRRAQLLGMLPIVIFPMLAYAVGPAKHPASVLTIPVVAFFLAAGLYNQFGLDGAAYGMHVLAGNDPAADLRGKTIATMLVSLPVMFVVLMVEAVITGGWAYVPAALLLTAGFIGVQSGVGCVLSVRAPQAVATGRNPWANRGAGNGCANGFISLGGMAVEGALCLPFAIAVVVSLRVWHPALLIVGLLSVGYGLFIWRAGLRMATRWVWWRLPELLEAISPKAAT